MSLRRLLRVATYNVHWCVGTDGVYDMDRVAEAIRNLDADVVCLQELHRCTARFPDDQLLGLSRRTQMPHVAFGKTRDGHPHGAATGPDATVGEYGNGILSRLPILHYSVVPFPRHTGYSRSQEPRNAVIAYVPFDGHIVGVACTHFGCDLSGCEQAAAVPVLTNHVRNVLDHQPLLNVSAFVVGGDLNVSSWRSAFRSLLRAGWVDAATSEDPSTTPHGGGRTMPSYLPFQRIDYLLRYGDALRVAAPSRVSEQAAGASDHLPVVAAFDVRPRDLLAGQGKGEDAAAADS